MNTKALPPRPGTRDGPYSKFQEQFGGPLVQQNDPQLYDLSQSNASSTNARNKEMYSTQGPNGAVILEGYRDDIMNGFQGEKPRYNPVSFHLPLLKKIINGCV